MNLVGEYRFVVLYERLKLHHLLFPIYQHNMEPEQTISEPEKSTAEPAENVTEVLQATTDLEPVATETSAEVQEPAANVKDENPVRTKMRSIDPANGPDISMGESGLSADTPMTVADMFKMTLSRVPDRTALKYRSGDTWKEITYRQYYDLTVAAAKSFLKVHLSSALKFLRLRHMSKVLPLICMLFFSLN